jgi:hypothetical protein
MITTIQARAGDILKVPLYIGGDVQLNSTMVYVKYNTSVLQPILEAATHKHDVGSLFADKSPTVLIKENTTGEIYVTVATERGHAPVNPGANTPRAFLFLYFQVIAGGSADITLSGQQAILHDDSPSGIFTHESKIEGRDVIIELGNIATFSFDVILVE